MMVVAVFFVVFLIVMYVFISKSACVHNYQTIGKIYSKQKPMEQCQKCGKIK